VKIGGIRRRMNACQKRKTKLTKVLKSQWERQLLGGLKCCKRTTKRGVIRWNPRLGSRKVVKRLKKKKRKHFDFDSGKRCSTGTHPGSGTVVGKRRQKKRGVGTERGKMVNFERFKRSLVR